MFPADVAAATMLADNEVTAIYELVNTTERSVAGPVRTRPYA